MWVLSARNLKRGLSELKASSTLPILSFAGLPQVRGVPGPGRFPWRLPEVTHISREKKEARASAAGTGLGTVAEREAACPPAPWSGPRGCGRARAGPGRCGSGWAPAALGTSACISIGWGGAGEGAAVAVCQRLWNTAIVNMWEIVGETLGSTVGQWASCEWVNVWNCACESGDWIRGCLWGPGSVRGNFGYDCQDVTNCLLSGTLYVSPNAECVGCARQMHIKVRIASMNGWENGTEEGGWLLECVCSCVCLEAMSYL